MIIGINSELKSHCYRGAATDKAVRTVYSLDGLLPARRLGLQEEVNRARLWIQRCGSKLEQFQALVTLKETNRDCFFGLLLQNIDDLLPVVYTPTGTELSFPIFSLLLFCHKRCYLTENPKILSSMYANE